MLGISGIQLDAIAVPARSEGSDQGAAGADHGVEDDLAALGEEFDKFLRQALGKLSGVAEHTFLARGWVVDEPGFLEFQPLFRLKIVKAVGSFGHNSGGELVNDEIGEVDGESVPTG